jgi:hypothetical protein
LQFNLQQYVYFDLTKTFSIPAILADDSLHASLSDDLFCHAQSLYVKKNLFGLLPFEEIFQVDIYVLWATMHCFTDHIASRRCNQQLHCATSECQ